MIKRFKRSFDTKSYKPIFYIISEGEETELLYFEILKKQCVNIVIKVIPSNKKTAAKQLLAKAKEIAENKKLKESDEIWLVVDKDGNSRADLNLLFSWAENNSQHGVALSNPKFEYWLLLHFEKGDGITNPADCDKRLKKHLPNFDKNHLDEKQILPRIQTAIEHARRKHGQCQDWFVDTNTMMFKLVDKIFNF